MRVCQHLRLHVLDTPGLWTQVDHIQNTAALSFVLDRTKTLAVDITYLHVHGPDDIIFESVAAHMHHISTLCVHFGQIGQNLHAIKSETRACTAFTTTAPLLQRLSIHGQRSVGSDKLVQISCYFTIPARNMPRLSSLQLHGVDLDTDFFYQLKSLRSFSFRGSHDTRFFGSAQPEYVSRLLNNLTTINLELAS